MRGRGVGTANRGSRDAQRRTMILAMRRRVVCLAMLIAVASGVATTMWPQPASAEPGIPEPPTVPEPGRTREASRAAPREDGALPDGAAEAQTARPAEDGRGPQAWAELAFGVRARSLDPARFDVRLAERIEQSLERRTRVIERLTVEGGSQEQRARLAAEIHFYLKESAAIEAVQRREFLLVAADTLPGRVPAGHEFVIYGRVAQVDGQAVDALVPIPLAEHPELMSSRASSDEAVELAEFTAIAEFNARPEQERRAALALDSSARAELERLLGTGRPRDSFSEAERRRIAELRRVRLPAGVVDAGSATIRPKPRR